MLTRCNSIGRGFRMAAAGSDSALPAGTAGEGQRLGREERRGGESWRMGA